MYIAHEGFLLKVIAEYQIKGIDYLRCTDFEEEDVELPKEGVMIVHELEEEFDPKPGDFLVTQFGDVVRFMKLDGDRYLTHCWDGTLFEASSKNFIYRIPSLHP